MAHRTKSQKRASKRAHAAKRSVLAPGHCAYCGVYLSATHRAQTPYCNEWCRVMVEERANPQYQFGTHGWGFCVNGHGTKEEP